MRNLKRQNLPESWHNACIFLLAAFWIAGLLLGAFLGKGADASIFSMMRTGQNRRVSIVYLLVVSLLPFLFSAFAVYCAQSWLLFPVCFFKMLCFGFSNVCICSAFDGAGWLARGFWMFSSTALLPLFLWFAIRCISDRKALSAQNLLFCLAVVFAVVAIDIRFVSPFWAVLIDY